MSQLMNRLKEIEELSEKYKLRSYEIASLNLLAIFEEEEMTYEKLKEELKKLHKKE